MKRTTSLIWLGVVMTVAAIAPVAASGTQQSAPDGTATVSSLIASSTPIKSIGRYATGFRAYRNGDLTIVQVVMPWQNATSDDALTYVLYPRDETAPPIGDADLVVGTPVASIATMSTTFLPQLALIDDLDKLVAIDSGAYAYSTRVHEMIDSGSVVEVGSGPGVDVEKLLEVQPELIMVNSYGGEWDAQPVLEKASLPVVVAGDWVENSPLGRAEWVLFTSLFFDRFDSALAEFNQIAREYDRLVSLAGTTDPDSRPTVLINAPYQGTWAVAGGDSYAAQFVRDAGGAYVWKDDASTGSLFLDFESVYSQAGDADVWINPGAWTSLAQGAAEDARFASFRSFADGTVYSNNRRVGSGGGNDYFESGALNPNIILKDLIWIFHPDLVPDYEPYYYQRLK